MQKVMRFIPCLALFAAGCATEEVEQPTVEESAVVQEEPAQPVYVPQVNTISTANPVANVARAEYKQVVLDGNLAQWVAVQDVRRSRTNDGYERIQVLVKNMTASPIRTRYRFDWQDANGVVVMDPDNSGWEKMTLIPGDDGTFTSIAPKKDCADFRLRMAVIQQQ